MGESEKRKAKSENQRQDKAGRGGGGEGRSNAEEGIGLVWASVLAAHPSVLLRVPSPASATSAIFLPSNAIRLGAAPMLATARDTTHRIQPSAHEPRHFTRRHDFPSWRPRPPSRPRRRPSQRNRQLTRQIRHPARQCRRSIRRGRPSIRRHAGVVVGLGGRGPARDHSPLAAASMRAWSPRKMAMPRSSLGRLVSNHFTVYAMSALALAKSTAAPSTSPSRRAAMA
jgi:hypothetical protein